MEQDSDSWEAIFSCTDDRIRVLHEKDKNRME